MNATTLDPNATDLRTQIAWREGGAWHRGFGLTQYNVDTLSRVISQVREALLAECDTAPRLDAEAYLGAWDASTKSHSLAVDTLALVGEQAERSHLDIGASWTECRDRSLRVREIVAAALTA